MKAIEINNLTKNYGKKRGIKNISFTVDEGDIVGFIGPNGAGKSTTIKLLLNFIYKTEGELKIFGLDCEKDSRQIKELVGYVPSETRLYDEIKVKDILKYGESFYENSFKERVKDLCNRLEIEEDKKIRELSFGNKKKVSIALALINSPKLIILDEPTNGLDPLIQKKVFEILLEENKKGTTIFLSSHNLNEVQNYCNKAIIIKNGEIACIENMSNIKDISKKKIKIKCNDISKEEIEKIGGKNILEEKDEIVFSYEKDINSLIAFLSNKKIDDIQINDEELLDTFLSYYKEEEK